MNVIDFSNENGIVAKNRQPLFRIPFSAMTFCRARFGCGGLANVVHNWFQITARLRLRAHCAGQQGM